jgi:hypothetical protein
MKLVLPLPPSVNQRRPHPMAEYRAKNEYRKQAWARACQQAMPRAEQDLPRLVRVHATFFVRNRRDRVDNLPGSLKWALDTLKARQTGDVAWRQGMYDQKGYLIDDSEAYCAPGVLEQHVERRNPRLELVIEPITI